MACCSSSPCRAWISAPMVSAMRSTALVVTSSPASVSSCWRPASKEAPGPPGRSCAGHRERTRFLRYPTADRQELAGVDKHRTSSRDGRPPPCRARSAERVSASLRNERSGHSRKAAAVFGGNGLFQKLAQRRSPAPVQGIAQSHLDLLQIQVAGLVLLGEDHCQQRVYLATDFLVDRFGRFFSCAVISSWPVGRAWQIRSLTSKSF